MPPNLGRFAERLTCLSHAELVVLAARGCVADDLARREADRLIAARQPTPPWIVDVLMHRDLLPQFLLCLDPRKDGAAARVCREWARAWAVRTRRVLRWTELPDVPLLLPDVPPYYVSCLAALPDGRLAICSDGDPPEAGGKDIHIVDSSFHTTATIFVELDVAAMVAGDIGLYVSTYSYPAEDHDRYQLRLYDYDAIPSIASSAILPVKASTEVREIPSHLAVGDGAVWCMGEAHVYRFDARTLECSFQFEVGGGPRPSAMTVHANELYIVFPAADVLQPYTIKVYSFGGQLIRSFPVPSSGTQRDIQLQPGEREPVELFIARDRLYLSETVPAADFLSEIFVLTTEGALLDKIVSGDGEFFPYMCAFDDKLLLTKVTDLGPDDDGASYVHPPNVVVALSGL